MSCSIGDEAFPLISAGQDSIAHRIPIAIYTMQMNTLPIIDALDPSVSGGKIKGTGCENEDLSVMCSLFLTTHIPQFKYSFLKNIIGRWQSGE